MAFFDDKIHQLTKKIRQGRSSIKQEFIPLAKRIHQTYNVKPLNIVYQDTTLKIIFEFEKEAKMFELKGGSFDSRKQQAIASFFLDEVRSGEYSEKDIRVVFSAFEPEAKHDVLDSIPADEIDLFVERYQDKNIWKVAKYLYISAFVYTEEQRKRALADGTKELLKEELFTLVKKYDEFNYFTRENFIFYLDSKEIFDKDFQGNWWYYYK
ncbi:MAG: hypothetical protein LBV71_20230 [Prevotella sp.]|jgi:propanediol dehydratase small subunit|nr:hypothetical protein [Prevotella sp.]